MPQRTFFSKTTKPSKGPSPSVSPGKVTAKKKPGRVRTILKWVSLIIVAFFLFQAITWPNVGRLAMENPPTTAMIEARLSQARSQGLPERREQTWVPYHKISSNLKRAVLAGEDAKFFGHDGFDREALEKAMQENWEKKKFVRGASTISQQLVKNLYLSESKNPLRKLKEAIITWQMEKTLPKERILEIYLNVIEWGDGVYGAEAASQKYFRKPAANLSSDEAAYLAAMIPNPRTVFNPEKNARRVQRRKRLIARLMTAIRLPK
jgi:monofunctional biosynthetic peptidoglycan transglycosylase